MERHRWDGGTAPAHSRRDLLLRLWATVSVVAGERAAGVAAAPDRRRRRGCKAPRHARCDGIHCVGLLDDPANCGVCGHVCPSPFPTCVNGTCCNSFGTCICAPTGSACNRKTCCAAGGGSRCVHGACP